MILFDVTVLLTEMMLLYFMGCRFISIFLLFNRTGASAFMYGLELCVRAGIFALQVHCSTIWSILHPMMQCVLPEFDMICYGTLNYELKMNRNYAPAFNRRPSC